MLNRLFSNFNTRIISKWQYFKPDKLLTELFSKTVAHITEELNSNNPIVLVGVIMCHLYDMLEYIISSIFISEFVGDASELKPSSLFDIKLIEIQELDENGYYGGLDMLLEVLVFLQVYDNIWYFVEKRTSYRITIFYYLVH